MILKGSDLIVSVTLYLVKNKGIYEKIRVSYKVLLLISRQLSFIEPSFGNNDLLPDSVILSLDNVRNRSQVDYEN